MPWHTDTAETTAQMLQVDASVGLHVGEAAERLARHGRNDIAATPTPGPLRLFARQFTDVLVLILRAAAAPNRPQNLNSVLNCNTRSTTTNTRNG